MTADARRYSYFLERRESDKRWVATVTEFPGLSAESRIRNRALYALQDQVAAELARRRRAGEPIPEQTEPPAKLSDFLGIPLDEIR